MKLITLIIPGWLQETTIDKIKSFTEVESFYVSYVHEYSDQRKNMNKFSNKELVQGHVTKIKLEILLEEGLVERFFKELRSVEGLAKNCFGQTQAVNEIKF